MPWWSKVVRSWWWTAPRAYQSLDISKNVCTDALYPSSWPDSISHFLRLASNRKPWMFAHVNPMSSQKFLAGTSRWTTSHGSSLSFPHEIAGGTGNARLTVSHQCKDRQRVPGTIRIPRPMPHHCSGGGLNSREWMGHPNLKRSVNKRDSMFSSQTSQRSSTPG